MSEGNRQLTDDEQRLVRWMLQHGDADATTFLPHLDLAKVTPERCLCGCASFGLQISGHPVAPPGVHPIADFVFGEGDALSGIFVFESGGLLSGVEVYGLAGDAPRSLPQPEELRPVL